MLPHAHAVDPHLGKVSHGAELEQVPPLRVRMSGRSELAPVPDNPVVGRKNFLENPRHPQARSIGGRMLKPFLFAANVLGIAPDEPLTVERQSGSGSACAHAVEGLN